MKRVQNSVPHAYPDHTFAPGLAAAASEIPEAAGTEVELENSIRPMLEAVVRMAGADAGALRFAGSEPARQRLALGVGVPTGADGMARDAFAIWCGPCAESRNPESDCIRDRICGVGESVASEVSGPVCRHVVAVPLRYRDAPVGMLRPAFRREVRGSAPDNDDASRGRQADWRGSGERTVRSREPSCEPHRRAADDGERGP